jgi:hypothetical protein
VENREFIEIVGARILVNWGLNPVGPEPGTWSAEGTSSSGVEGSAYPGVTRGKRCVSLSSSGASATAPTKTTKPRKGSPQRAVMVSPSLTPTTKHVRCSDGMGGKARQQDGGERQPSGGEDRGHWGLRAASRPHQKLARLAVVCLFAHATLLHRLW